MEFQYIFNGGFKVEIKDFFIFGTSHIASTFQANSTSLATNIDDANDYDDLIIGKYDSITFPVIFKQAYGKKLLDILGTGWPGLYLISDKMKKILKENQLTGWKTFPIKLYDKKENEILGYQGFSVVGRCGPIDDRKAEIVNRQRIPTGPTFKVYKGLYIGLDKWDGSDFFIPNESLFFIVTKKTQVILSQINLTNIQFKNLIDFEISVNAI